MKRLLAVLLTILPIVALCCSCGSKPYEEIILGTWYGEERRYAGGVFSFYDNGTCDSPYGSKWAIVNENILRITDSWGDSENFSIKSIDDDCLVLEYPNGVEYKFYRSYEEWKKWEKAQEGSDNDVAEAESAANAQYASSGVVADIYGLSEWVNEKANPPAMLGRIE